MELIAWANLLMVLLMLRLAWLQSNRGNVRWYVVDMCLALLNMLSFVRNVGA